MGKKIILVALLFCSLFAKSQSLAENAAIFAASQRDTIITGAGSQTTLNNNILLQSAGSGWTDTWTIGSRQEKTVAIGVVTASGTVTAGVLTFEESNDNGATQVFPLYLSEVSTAPAAILYTTSLNTSSRIFTGAIHCRYIRARISIGITGTTTGIQAITTYSPNIAPVGSGVPVFSSIPTNFQTQSQLTTTSTPNGATMSFLNAAAKTNATSLKASTGNVFSVMVTNASAAVKYVRLYNKASAPTVGTDIALITIAVPATSSKEIIYDIGWKFNTGIAFAITGGAAATDATAVAAGDVQLLINWQ